MASRFCLVSRESGGRVREDSEQIPVQCVANPGFAQEIGFAVLHHISSQPALHFSSHYYAKPNRKNTIIKEQNPSEPEPKNHTKSIMQ